jgi:HPt (histidine-containing phosphotransfer) domain-containing protein
MDPTPSFFPAHALQDLRGNETALRAMAAGFLETCQAALERIALAQARGDAGALLHEVHSLRGSFAVLRAETALGQAVGIHRELDAGRAPSQESVDALLAEVVQLAAELRDWLDAR